MAVGGEGSDNDGSEGLEDAQEDDGDEGLKDARKGKTRTRRGEGMKRVAP